MKRLTIAFLMTAASLSIFTVYAEEAPSEPKEPEAAKVEEGTLTDQQISELRTEFTDASTQKTYRVMHFKIEPAPVTSRSEKAKYRESGKAPVHFTYSVYEINKAGKKPVEKRLQGTCNLYMKNADGEVVLKKSIPLDKMCPS